MTLLLGSLIPKECYQFLTIADIWALAGDPSSTLSDDLSTHPLIPQAVLDNSGHLSPAEKYVYLFGYFDWRVQLAAWLGGPHPLVPAPLLAQAAEVLQQCAVSEVLALWDQGPDEAQHARLTGDLASVSVVCEFNQRPVPYIASPAATAIQALLAFTDKKGSI